MKKPCLISRHPATFLAAAFLLSGALAPPRAGAGPLFRALGPVIDLVPSLATSVAGTDAPRPLWSSALPDPSIDLLAEIPGQGILVSTVTQTWTVSRYDLGYGQFAMIDPATGKIRWTAPRVKSFEEENEIVALSPRLIAYNDSPDASYYYALRLEDGRRAWRYGTKKESSAKLDGERRVVVLVERPRPGKKPPAAGETVDAGLRALDAMEGKSLWRTTVKRVPAVGPLPWMAIFGKKVLLSTGRLSAFSLDDGASLWENADVGAMDDACLALELPDSGLLVSDRSGTVIAIRGDGSTAWRRELGAPLGLGFASGDDLYIEAAEGQGGRRFVKLDARSGEIAWSARLAGEIWSPAAAVGGRLAMAVKDEARHEARLAFLDTATGTLTSETLLPQESLAAPSLGLRLLPDALVLAGEHWIGSFDAASGRASWLHRFDPAEPTLRELYDSQAEGVRAALAKQGVRGGNDVDVMRGARASLQFSIRQNQAQHAQLLRDADSTLLDLRMNIDQGRFLSRMAFSTALMSATLGMYEQLFAMWAVAEQRRATMPWRIGIDANASLGMSSFQGGFFARGVRDGSGGSALLVVEMATGRWLRIPVTPPQREAFEPRLEYLFPRLSADGGRVFARGTGYDPTLWTAARNKRRTLVPDAVYLVPMPSLLAYEISPSALKDSEAYEPLRLDKAASETGPRPGGAVFDRAVPLGGGRFRVETCGRVGIVDGKGRFLLEPRYDRIDAQGDGTSILVSDGKYGLADASFAIVVDLIYDELGPFREGRARVKVGKAYGYIDRSGAIVVEPRYEEAGDFSDGRAWTREGGKIKFIDPSGAVVAGTDFDGAALEFREGLLPVSKRKKSGEEVWGYADAAGKLAIEHSFVAALGFSGGLAPAAANRIGMTRGLAPTYGFIDKKGDWVVSPRYDSIGPFRRGLALVTNEYGYAGYVDAQGREAIPLEYRNGSDFGEDGYALVRRGEDWLYIDTAGKTYAERPAPAD